MVMKVPVEKYAAKFKTWKWQLPSREDLQKVMPFISWAVNHFAPLFIITSPVTSYADQIWSIHKKRSSAGFSLDIPLIMLVASILKLFYWFGSRYDLSLLIQAAIMVVVQLLLLRVALRNRPPVGAQHSLSTPFSGTQPGGLFVNRPYNFWQWRNERPYWQFVAYYTVALAAMQIIVGPVSYYTALQGYFALSVEATLPLPQILANQKNRSCKGFRLSVLVNWLIGDAFKMMFFFLSEGSVPWAFKLCGMFQAACDCYLGVQYWMFGEGEALLDTELKDPRLS